MSNQEIVVANQEHAVMRHESGELSVAEIINKVGKVREVAEKVMKEGIHFGTIPGTPKPSLWKPGGEILGLTFRLSPRYAGEREPVDLGNGHREYVIRCDLFHIHSGEFYGSGVGSCSTLEAKYRYRTGPKEFTGIAVPKEYWNMRSSDPVAALQLIGGPGHAVGKNDAGAWEICIQGEKVEHDNPADYYNTVLKMAAKRAFIDAILKATAASEVYTQDLEDMMENGVIGTVTNGKKPTLKQPQRKTQAPPKQEQREQYIDPDPIDNIPYDLGQDDFPPMDQTSAGPEVSTTDTVRLISDKQAGRLYGIARSAGCTDAIIKDELIKMGFKSSKDIPVSQYDDIVSHFQSYGKK